MIVSIEVKNRTFKIDTGDPLPLAIPLYFNGVQPNAYDVEKAVSTPCKAGEMVGDTRLGGSVNFERYEFIPHCNGTHTECVGHITNERIAVNDCLKDTFILADLISVSPEKASATNDTYAVGLGADDKLITRRGLEAALETSRTQATARLDETDENLPKALIVRTLPNDEDKLSKTYLEEIPPFFSNEAMSFITGAGIEHILVDMPSIDRIFDEGKLSNHRTFWNVEPGSFEISPESFISRTITELIYVRNEIADGRYLLNLQIAPFQTDASPSRPLLFEIIG